MTTDEPTDEHDAQGWWDSVWWDSPENYCGLATDLSTPERDYVASIRGMVPLWLAQHGPSEWFWFRCPLTPGHEGPHITPVGDVDFLFVEWVWVDSDNGGSAPNSWYLTWGPERRNHRSVAPLASCGVHTRDADGQEWACSLMQGHPGTCRSNIRVMRDDEEIEESDLTNDGDWDEAAWIAERDEQIVKIYLAGDGTYQELADMQGLSRYRVQQVVASHTTQQERAEALRQWRRNVYAREKAAFVFAEAEDARLLAEDEKSGLSG